MSKSINVVGKLFNFSTLLSNSANCFFTDIFILQYKSLEIVESDDPIKSC